MSIMPSSPSLLDLPEELICVLLRYLDATSLYLLGRACSQLEQIIRRHFTLWRRIDARRAPNNYEKITYVVDRCYDDGNSWTHTLLLRGDYQSEMISKLCLFSTFNCYTRLTILAFENQTIDGSKHNAMAFPPQLHELSLKNSTVTKPLDFFKGSGEHFKELKVLILEGCDWLTSSAFMPISKYRNLEILSVYKCTNVENSIAYLSLSGQGFRSLKILDARLSPLGNTLIRAIYRMQSLLAIYLQNQDISYKLDYFKRKLEIMKGSSSRDFTVEDEEFDLITDEIECEDRGMLDDDGLIDYLSIQSELKDATLPKSVLYLDPYETCTCGYEDKKIMSESDSPDDDDDSPFSLLLKKINKLKRQVCSSPRGLPDSGSSARTRISFFDSRSRSYNGHLYCVGVSGSRHQSPADPPPDDELTSVIKVYICHHDDETQEPAAKRARINEPVPGPSGLNNENNSDSDFEEGAAPKPPTPRPERSASYRIYFRDFPIVQIENINITHKDIKVPLKRLSLRGYKKITNAALRYINDLDLDLLDLTYTSVSAEAIHGYLRSHPLCRVVHERFCTCLPNLHF